MRTKEPTILEQARARVSALEKKARGLLKVKQEFEVLAGAEVETQSLALDFAIKEGPPPMSPDLRIHLKSRGELPAEPPPVLTARQQAQLAHSDYIEACYRLGDARMELAALEKKVSETAALVACIS